VAHDVTARALSGYFLGLCEYRACLSLQERLHAARTAGSIGDTVLFVEHPTVITLGRGTHHEHLLATASQLAQLGVEVVETGRGGDITLHAPGQLVCYPIVDLGPDRKDVRRYVKALAAVMQTVVRSAGIEAGLLEGHVGLWANQSSPARYRGSDSPADLVKLGAIGVRISRWVTMHGFALNLSPDLGLYSLIVPCGIREFGVSSLAQLSGLGELSVADAAVQAFAALISGLGADAERSTFAVGEPPATINTLPNGVPSDAP
jgi:lipoyl(octanoyl) transferase